jgi:hypothetical protein
MTEDALIKILEHYQNERLKDFPTVEAFREAKLNYASFLDSDFHLRSYKKKAEKYKPGTIQYNKNMARYNELAAEIAELRHEAAEGKTTRELQIEATIKENISTQIIEDAERAETARLEAMSTEDLRTKAAQHNKIQSDQNMSIKARVHERSIIKQIINILSARDIDIIPDLNAQLHKMEV